MDLDPGKGLSLSGGGASVNARGYLVYEAADLHGGAPPLRSDADTRFADIIVTARAFDGHATAAFVYDFRNRTRPIEDAWIAVARPGLALVAGNHKEPFSLQALNGSPDRTLAEAAIPQALAPDRALGVSVGAFRRDASLTAVLEGGYITVSWAITGEVRPYRMSSSIGSRPPVSGSAASSASR